MCGGRFWKSKAADIKKPGPEFCAISPTGPTLIGTQEARISFPWRPKPLIRRVKMRLFEPFPPPSDLFAKVDLPQPGGSLLLRAVVSEMWLGGYSKQAWSH